MNKDHHYLSPKLVGRQIGDKGGYGLFAREHIEPDELLIVWGGDIWPADSFNELTEQQQSHCLMVEENLFLVSFRDGEADWINHCCDPNAWLVGNIAIHARQAIAPDEEVTFDYATSDGRSDSHFHCECHSPVCRHTFTGDDWMLPELQLRYVGHFMPYLQRRIEHLKQTTAK